MFDELASCHWVCRYEIKRSAFYTMNDTQTWNSLDGSESYKPLFPVFENWVERINNPCHNWSIWQDWHLSFALFYFLQHFFNDTIGWSHPHWEPFHFLNQTATEVSTQSHILYLCPLHIYTPACSSQVPLFLSVPIVHFKLSYMKMDCIPSLSPPAHLSPPWHFCSSLQDELRCKPFSGSS